MGKDEDEALKSTALDMIFDARQNAYCSDIVSFAALVLGEAALVNIGPVIDCQVDDT